MDNRPELLVNIDLLCHTRSVSPLSKCCSRELYIININSVPNTALIKFIQCLLLISIITFKSHNALYQKDRLYPILALHQI